MPRSTLGHSPPGFGNTSRDRTLTLFAKLATGLTADERAALGNCFHRANHLSTERFEQGRFVVTAGSDRILRAWNAKIGGMLGRWQMEQVPEGVTVSQDRKFAAVSHGGFNKASH